MRTYRFMKKNAFIIVYLLLAALLFAQMVSEKKEIAVFRLSRSGGVPSEIADRIDQRITAVITSFKRFNVIGMQYRLKTTDVSGFIDKIQETRETQSELPETVLSGEEAFTRADWERLTGAFLLFIPRLTAYDENIIYKQIMVDDKKTVEKFWEVKIEGSLTIIDVSGETGQRVIPLSALRTSKQYSYAVDGVIDDLAASVHTAIKFEPEFALTSGILAVDRQANTVTIELGKDIGIKEGDEYTLQKAVFVGGKQSWIETGFFIISEVYDNFSIGKVVYANQPVVEGDAVKEQPIRRVSFRGYGGITVPLTGVSAKQSREYLRIQPTFGIQAVYRSHFHLSFSIGYEYAFQQPVSQSVALNAKPLTFVPIGMGYIGVGVYNFYTARFNISPELQLCYAGTFVYPQTDTASKRTSRSSTTAYQLGGRALVSAHYFITRTWTADVSAGIGYMYSSMNAKDAAKRLLADSEVERINNYTWDILSSHVNFYLFIGITRRF